MTNTDRFFDALETLVELGEKAGRTTSAGVCET